MVIVIRYVNIKQKRFVYEVAGLTEYVKALQRLDAIKCKMHELEEEAIEIMNTLPIEVQNIIK